MARYLLTMAAAAAALVAGVMAINYTADPFWLRADTPALGAKRLAFNEWRLKAHLIGSGAVEYDSLLIGSSRTTYMNPKDLSGGRYLNVSVPMLHAVDYAPVLELASAGRRLREVVIGMDFFVTKRPTEVDLYRAQEWPAMAAEARGFWARARVLASLDGVYYAWRNARCSLSAVCGSDYYDADYVKQMRPLQGQERAAPAERNLRLYRTDIFGPGYEWNTGLDGALAGLRASYPQTRFTVFTTPVSFPMFCVEIGRARFERYEAWLGIAVARFGAVYDFLGANTITMNAQHYTDGHHFTPAVGAMVAARLAGRTDEVAADFGVRVDASNLAAHLADVRRQLAGCDADPLSR